MSRRVVVGMSGGVDSSMAACLLLEQGYEVTGVTMQLRQENAFHIQEENDGCCGLTAAEEARRVAMQLGIRHFVMDFSEEFQTHVINYFTDEYRNGRTPNPCIACNRYVKWEALLRRGMELGADYIATGHYARIIRQPDGRYALKKSVTAAKDQTYALYSLTQEQLARTVMPVGEYEKETVRKRAEEAGLVVAHKPDSMEICFVPDGDYASFIEQETGVGDEPGNFVDIYGNVLGVHRGITHYTIGQRKGLGLAMGHPVFVTEIRPETREVVIGESEDVFRKTLHADHLNFMSVPEFDGEVRAVAKIRYNHRGDDCVVRMTGHDMVEVVFDRPQRAVTPGQAVVFYDGDVVMGGGTIMQENLLE